MFYKSDSVQYKKAITACYILEQNPPNMNNLFDQILEIHELLSGTSLEKPALE